MDAGRAAARLTRQLLAFSRRQQLRPTAVDVNDLITRMAGLLTSVLGSSIVARLSLSERVLPIHIDAGQLEQVLLNLAANARDAMTDGGTLRVGTRVTPGEPPWVSIIVSNTGIGMTPETQLRVFEPFYTTKEEGSGLGIATVYGIVMQSGGRAFLTSRPGEERASRSASPRPYPAATSHRARGQCSRR
jgi:signal transduction histidine kinase